jgi:hypothetical protein
MADCNSDTAHRDKNSVCHQNDTEKAICTGDTASQVTGVWGTVIDSHSHWAAGESQRRFLGIDKSHSVHRYRAAIGQAASVRQGTDKKMLTLLPSHLAPSILTRPHHTSCSTGSDRAHIGLHDFCAHQNHFSRYDLVCSQGVCARQELASPESSKHWADHVYAPYRLHLRPPVEGPGQLTTALHPRHSNQHHT